MPRSAPGVFTAAILAFVNARDEFPLALSMMNRLNMRTPSVGITLYQELMRVRGPEWIRTL